MSSPPIGMPGPEEVNHHGLLPPALPEPIDHEEQQLDVHQHHHHHQDVVAHATEEVALDVADAEPQEEGDDAVPQDPGGASLLTAKLEEQQQQQQHHCAENEAGEEANGQEQEGVDGEGEGGLKRKKPRGKKLPLTKHEGLTFASRGVYVDPESGQLRCSCNHKPCDKWDAYGYARHFTFKVHRKYETERLDDTEMARLRDCKEIYTRDNPIVEDPASVRKKRKMREGEKILNQEELRVQERHWMSMWKDAKNELRQLRLDLKIEPDEDVRAEMAADIEGLKRRKGDWARLLGLNEVTQEIPMTTAVPF